MRPSAVGVFTRWLKNIPVRNRWALACIALPATVCFGPIAALGVVLGGSGLMDPHGFFSGWILLVGLGGILGLTGLWVRLCIAPASLATRSTRNRIGIAILLLAGVASLMAILFLSGLVFVLDGLARSDAEAWLIGAMVLLAGFGFWLAVSTLRGRAWGARPRGTDRD